MQLQKAFVFACLLGAGCTQGHAAKSSIPACADPATIKVAIAIADDGYKKRGYVLTVTSLDSVTEQSNDDKTRTCSANATLSDGGKMSVTFSVIDDGTGYLLKLIKWGG